jgi:hypothetical protein
VQAPPVHLTDKTRELLRLLASDPVMREAMGKGMERLPSAAMLRVSTMTDAEWQNLEDKYRVTS